MEQALQIGAVCVLTALLAVVVRRGTPETALLLVLAAAAVVLLSLAESLRTALGFFTGLTTRTGLAPELFLPLYKTVGIALVVKVSGGLCRDAGAASLASVVEIAGTVCALLVALPLLEAVLSALLELMG